MSSPKDQLTEDEYMFSRDHKASIRLNYQHFWTTNLTKYHVNPKINLNKKDLYIADIGTGTGVWPIDLAQYLPPETKLHGFDISGAQFPPAQWLPANVKLHKHNAFAEWPVEWHGLFDLVNIRFMITVLGSREAFETLIGNVKSLLKPSGYIQWLDLHPQSVHTIPSRACEGHGEKDDVISIQQSATEKVVQLMRKPHEAVDYSYIVNGGKDTASKFNFQVLAQDIIPIPPTYRTYWNHSNMLAVEEFATKMERKGGSGEDKGKMARQMLGLLGKEFEEGWSVAAEFFCWVVTRNEV